MDGTDGARLDDGTGDLDRPMTLQEHLAELRTRLIKSAIGVVIGMIGGFLLSERVLSYINARVKTADAAAEIIQTKPTELITVYLQITFYVGVALALPLIIYQIIRFLAPGLTRTERRYLYAMMPFVVLFFVLGALFASSIAVPNMLKFLLEFARRAGVANQLRVEEVFGMFLDLSFWTGVVFELPLVMFMLATLGIAPYRLLRKTRKYAAVGLMVLAAVITPSPDPLNMLVIWAPMYLLFELGLVLARFARPRRQTATLTLLAGAVYASTAPYLRAARAVRARRQGAGLVV